MPTVGLLPPVRAQFLDSTGKPLTSGRVRTFLAGSSTSAPTYTDATGTVVNTEPIILDERGEADIWLDLALAYKIIIQNPNGSTIWSRDNITGIGGGGGGVDSATVKVNSADPAAGYLVGKLVDENGDAFPVINIGGVQVVQITTGDKLVAASVGQTPGYLMDVLDVGASNVTIAEIVPGKVRLTAPEETFRVKVNENDSPDYLNQKIVGVGNIQVTEDVGPGGYFLEISTTAIPDASKVMVDSADTTPGYLGDKLVAGTNITLTKQNIGANENIRISASGVTDHGALTGLADDDHTQYLLVGAARGAEQSVYDPVRFKAKASGHHMTFETSGGVGNGFIDNENNAQFTNIKTMKVEGETGDLVLVGNGAAGGLAISSTRLMPVLDVDFSPYTPVGQPYDPLSAKSILRLKPASGTAVNIIGQNANGDLVTATSFGDGRYLELDGTSTMAGTLKMGVQDITDVKEYYASGGAYFGGSGTKADNSVLVSGQTTSKYGLLIAGANLAGYDLDATSATLWAYGAGRTMYLKTQGTNRVSIDDAGGVKLLSVADGTSADSKFVTRDSTGKLVWAAAGGDATTLVKVPYSLAGVVAVAQTMKHELGFATPNAWYLPSPITATLIGVGIHGRSVTSSVLGQTVKVKIFSWDPLNTTQRGIGAGTQIGTEYTVFTSTFTGTKWEAGAGTGVLATPVALPSGKSIYLDISVMGVTMDDVTISLYMEQSV